MISSKNRLILLLAFIVLLISFYTFSYYVVQIDKNRVLGIFTNNISNNLSSNNDNDYLVTKIIDGDTIVIETNEHIRLIGIDAPEISNKECFASESKEYLFKLLKNKKVRLEKDKSEKDKYGRLLRYVYLDNLFINQDLVEKGYAKSVMYKPDIKYSKFFEIIENNSQKNKKGMWGVCL